MSIGSLPGLSGYDFSGIVERLVDVYSMPKTKMIQQKSELQVQQEVWRQVNTRLDALDKKLQALKEATLWTASKATSNNTDLLTATAGTSATQGIYNVVVNQTAQAQTVVSAVQNVSSATAETALGAGSFSIIVNGNEVNISIGAKDSLSTIATKINNANAGVNASVVQVNGGFQLAITDSKTGTASTASFADASWTFNLNIDGAANSIEIQAVDTLTDIALKIQALGATTTVDEVAGTISVTDTQGTITYNKSQLNGGKILESLGFLDASGALKDASSDPSRVSAGGITLTARDAQITVNGIPNITSSSNTFTAAIPGVTLNIKGADPSKTIVVDIAADDSVAESKVQEFVDEYNSVMDFIAAKLSYDPDTKVAGQLQGDSRLQGIQNRLRSMLGGTFSNSTGPYSILADIGISTSDADYGKSAALTFDKTKFNEALQANPQSVANLFGAPYGGVTPTNDITDKSLNQTLHQGVANYLHTYLDPMIKYGGSFDQTINSLDEQISDVNDRIEAFADRIDAYRTRQEAKFASLEAMLSGLNAQGAWLNSQVTAMQGSMQSSKK